MKLTLRAIIEKIHRVYYARDSDHGCPEPSEIMGMAQIYPLLYRPLTIKGGLDYLLYIDSCADRDENTLFFHFNSLAFWRS
jgi:hypothetical protein